MAKHSEGQQRLALLIDADNAPPGVVDGLLAEAARFGSTTVKRIYGDWMRISVIVTGHFGRS